MTDPASRSDAAAFPMGFREFVTLIAALMAMSAFGIDSMLPALPAMGESLGITAANQRQWIISAFVLGFGIGQIIYGPIADRYGRRPVLLFGLVTFGLASLSSIFASDFTTIIAARVLAGLFCAATRVLVVSIVRDRYSGRQMARVMSLAFMIFLIIPILAPSFGQLILLFADWEWIFVMLAAFGLSIAAWAALRLPETLHPEDRRPIQPHTILAAARIVLTSRVSIGYTIASTLLFGGLIGYVGSSQQIFVDGLGAGELFPILFALTAAAMGVASYLNSRIVERLGTRRLSHTALLCLIAITALHFGWALFGHDTLMSFVLLQGMTMACFSLATSNFNAMAMEPVGHIAGTAASIQGTLSTVLGGVIGAVIGQSFNGTTAPLAGSYLLLGVMTLGIVLVTERGRLFRAQHAGPHPA